MHENLIIFNLYSAFKSSILNAIFAEGICDTHVSVYGIYVLCISLFVLHVKCNKD